jgi:hypothetical protein
MFNVKKMSWYVLWRTKNFERSNFGISKNVSHRQLNYSKTLQSHIIMLESYIGIASTVLLRTQLAKTLRRIYS